jgi:hypothetical protein
MVDKARLRIEISVRGLIVPTKVMSAEPGETRDFLGFFLDNKVFQRILRPDRGRSTTAAWVHLATVARLINPLVLQGVPALSEIGTVVIETNVVQLSTPTGLEWSTNRIHF